MADNMKGQRHDRTALILYGTETGNSQDVAEQLGCVFERLHFVTSVSEMDEVEIVRQPMSQPRTEQCTHLCIIECALEVHSCHFCDLNYRTRRVSKKLKEVLEGTSEEAFASKLPWSRGFHHLWSRRQFLFKVCKSSLCSLFFANNSERFNWTVRKLHKRLEQLGAKEVYPRGEGDEQHDEG